MLEKNPAYIDTNLLEPTKEPQCEEEGGGDTSGDILDKNPV